jgi:hypothetical protein
MDNNSIAQVTRFCDQGLGSLSEPPCNLKFSEFCPGFVFALEKGYELLKELDSKFRYFK